MDEQQGIVLWDYIPPNTDNPEHPMRGIAAGALIGERFVGRRIRVTIEEL